MALNPMTEIHEMLDELDSQIRALHALSGLLNGCSGADSVEPSELTYLLDPIINSEKSLLDRMRQQCDRRHLVRIDASS